MVALCAEHHGLADGGAYSKEQLRSFKTAKNLNTSVSSRLPWKRELTIVRVGGVFSFLCVVVIAIQNEPAIWLSKGDDGSDLMNLNLRDSSGRLAFQMRDNDWITFTQFDDVEVPPQGRSLRLRSRAAGIDISMQFSAHPFSLVSELVGQSGCDWCETFFGTLWPGYKENGVMYCEIEGRLSWPSQIRMSKTTLHLPGRSQLRNVRTTFCATGVSACGATTLLAPATVTAEVTQNYFDKVLHDMRLRNEV